MESASSFVLGRAAVGLWCLSIGLLAQHPTWANESQSESKVRTRVVPLVFSSDNTEVAYGLGGVSIGAGQPQAALFALGFTSENNSKAVSVGALNYQIPNLASWYFSGFFYQSDMPDYRYFVSEDPGFAIRGNDSKPKFKRLWLKDFVARVQARWVLPIGAAKSENFSLLRRPILPEQSQPRLSLDPRQSGVSSIRFEWEQHQRDFTESDKVTDSGSDVFRLRFDWDNTGSRLIPTSGGRVRLASQWGNNHKGDDRWRLYEGTLSGFFGLPASRDWAKQQVLALNLHATHTPTWDSSSAQNRPPAYLGARLGGLMRLRGYRGSRFYDRSSWVYSAEYRLIPKWQPLANVLETLGYRVPWWQLTFFADTGRVAPDFDLREFHRNMKTTAGVGLRILAEGLLIRIDFARSEEESATLVAIDQAF